MTEPVFCDFGKLERAVFERDLLVKAMEDIKQATIEGRVCNDVAWFSQIETLHDFCDRILCLVGGENASGN